MNNVIRSMAATAALSVVAGSATAAQNGTPWDGLYAGLNVGGANPNACSSSTLGGSAINPGAATLSNCPGSGIVGGIQIGENFQTKRLVWGVSADVDLWSAKTTNSSVKSAGEALPPGDYGFTGKFSPKEFAILGGRIGYGGNLLMPYLRAGAVITTGSKNTTLNYLATGALTSAASFNGGKNFSSTGWAAGGGTEIGLNGAWSIMAEYLHVSLGSGGNSSATCAGAAAACAAFDAISLESTHKAFTSNMFRVGFNYWFDYWSKP